MKRQWVVVAVVALGLVVLAAGLGLAEKARKHEEKVTLDQVPEAVKKTILKEAAGAKIKEIEKETKDGKTIYEAEFIKDGKEVEVKVAPDGTVLKREVEEEEEEGEHHEKEQKVTLDQVPAPVKKTILAETTGGEIKEIELESEHGRAVYEAEYVKDGKKYEIEVSADGKVLEKKAKAKDDDDDEDDEEDDDD